MSVKIAKAIHFAKLAHDGQFRADGVEPYFNHVYRVFKRLLILFDNPEIGIKGLAENPYDKNLKFTEEDILCAALLHDIVEDTKYDTNDINKEFGYNVEILVIWLTNDDDMNLNRKERIDKREVKYFDMPNAAKVIKMADRIDNIKSINNKPSNFRDKYIYETIGLMWAIYDENINAPAIHKLFATLNTECVNVYTTNNINIRFTSEDSIGACYYRDLCIKWEDENKDKIEFYDRIRDA